MPPESGKSSESDLESIISLQDLRARRTKESKYMCTEPGCSAKFKRLDALDLHVFKHTGVKKHACIYNDCDKAYRTVTHLKRHLNTTHERTAPTPKTVACQISSCKQLFATNTNMQRHVREVHENPKVYACSYCTQKFTQKLKMRRHEITAHTGIYPYNCDKCGKGIYLQFQFERHVAKCKVYPCADCEQVFDKWTLYIKHCRENEHGRKAYKCEHCPNTYNKPSELKEHVGARHALAAGDEAVFKCTTAGCNKCYAYERNLKQHMRTSHGDRRYKCAFEDCGLEFKAKQELAKHRQQAHKNVKKTIAKAKKNVGSRKKRKDAGQTKLSNLAKLSNLTVDKNLDNLLRQRHKAALELTTNELAAQMSADEMEEMQSTAVEETESATLIEKVEPPTKKSKQEETSV